MLLKPNLVAKVLDTLERIATAVEGIHREIKRRNDIDDPVVDLMEEVEGISRIGRTS